MRQTIEKTRQAARMILGILLCIAIVFAQNKYSYAASSDWSQEYGQWYYYREDGTKARGWVEDRGHWYYLNPGSGAMQTGWVEDRGYWYYLNPGSGAMQTGWVEDRGYWYYLNPGSGAMQTGWLEDRGHWYYLNPGSGAMQTGWLEDRGYWYYLNPGSGAMQTGWAVDIADASNEWATLNQNFGDVAAGQWLAAHSYEYGFILRYLPNKEHITGYLYEPWHFRYVGREVAAAIGPNPTQTLEEYLGDTASLP